MTYQRYQRTGLLAIEPHAFLELFLGAAARGNELSGSVAIVDVAGPLSGPGEGCWDSYTAIRARMQAACASDATAIVLRVNSPGGDVAGCVDTAFALAAQASAAGKPLYAYVDAKACSAAYVLACAARSISVSSCALIGSIGVLSRREDFSAMNSARGIRVELITSGARKSDGSPDVPIGPEETVATQAVVDTTAAVLFGAVVSMRPNLTVEQIAAMQAAIFVGESAVSNGLADAVEPFESLLARIEQGESLMASAYEKALGALQEASKGKDANASAAKRALAALTAGEDAGDEDKDPPADAPPAEDKPAAASDSDAPADDEKKPKPAAAAAASDAPAQASASALALKALAEVHTMRTERANEKLAAERATLLASRPDFSAELCAILQTADMPTVRKTVDTLPRPAGTPNVLPLAAVSGTRGETQGAGEQPAHSHTAGMDRAMGLTTVRLGVERRGSSLVFGVQETVTKDKPAVPAAGGAK
jgi:ClpP class serine protease